MSVGAVNQKLTLFPYSTQVPGGPKGLLFGSVAVAGDATGGIAQISFDLDSGIAFQPLVSSVEVLGTAAAQRYISIHRLFPYLTDVASGQAMAVRNCRPIRYDGTGVYNLRTIDIGGGQYPANELMTWPGVIYRPSRAASAAPADGTVEVYVTPNTNGATYRMTFQALAFDPDEVNRISGPIGAPVVHAQ